MNLNLELTDHCNLRCRMCSQSLRDEAHGVPMRFMAFAAWRKALQGLEGMQEEVHLCPHWLGEPTLHPQFDQFVEYAFSINQQNRLFRTFKVHTNAVIFSAERARRLIRLAQHPDMAPDTFRAIHFSIDAFHPKTYTFIKGADHRDKVFRNITRFLELRKALNAQRPVAHIAFVVQDGNAHEAAEFVNYWKKHLGEHQLCADWPHFNQDAIYLRRWNTGEQSRADRLHAQACNAVGIPAQARTEGSF